MMFIAIGLAAGILAGLFGIGGGIIIVPSLLFFARMTPQAATGTSLAALLLPVGALGAWRYYHDGFLDIRAALWIALGIFLGAWLGANLALKLPPRDLQRAFAVFLLFVAGNLWYTAR
jgi:uncharacterized membrane protein YfcA